MRYNIAFRMLGGLATFVCVLPFVGCVAQATADDAAVAAEPAISWEDFKATATHPVDGNDINIVERDIAVTEPDAREASAFSASSSRVEYTPGDFNGDGRTDLVITTQAGS